jgi:hypothetical protein
MIFKNGASTPLNQNSGTLPDVSGAMLNYFQPMVFEPLSKTVTGFQVVETTVPVNFQGIIQPSKPRDLMLKPEGQRAWTWYTLHAEPSLTLDVDDVVMWNKKQTRIMSRQDFTLYGYVVYELVQDFSGSGPR